MRGAFHRQILDSFCQNFLKISGRFWNSFQKLTEILFLSFFCRFSGRKSNKNTSFLLNFGKFPYFLHFLPSPWWKSCEDTFCQNLWTFCEILSPPPTLKNNREPCTHNISCSQQWSKFSRFVLFQEFHVRFSLLERRRRSYSTKVENRQHAGCHDRNISVGSVDGHY